jgi:hypothetical protein
MRAYTVPACIKSFKLSGGHDAFLSLNRLVLRPIEASHLVVESTCELNVQAASTYRQLFTKLDGQGQFSFRLNDSSVAVTGLPLAPVKVTS